MLAWGFVSAGRNDVCKAGKLLKDSGFANGSRVQLIPGSRYDHETCACATLKVKVVQNDGYYLIKFDDDRSYQYEWKDLVVCTEAGPSTLE